MKSLFVLAMLVLFSTRIFVNSQFFITPKLAACFEYATNDDGNDAVLDSDELPFKLIARI